MLRIENDKGLSKGKSVADERASKLTILNICVQINWNMLKIICYINMFKILLFTWNRKWTMTLLNSGNQQAIWLNYEFGKMLLVSKNRQSQQKHLCKKRSSSINKNRLPKKSSEI